MSCDSSNNGGSSWLGFSLSPQMKMDLPSDHPLYITGQQQGPFLHHLNHSPLTVMPLKSDGSLCIHPPTSTTTSSSSSSPKLEDFLGAGAGRPDHHHNIPSLTLDSYYNINNQEDTNSPFHFHTHNLSSSSSYYPAAFHWITPSCFPNFDNHNNHLQDLQAACCVGGDLQSLTLSMSPGSQSSSVTATASNNNNSTTTTTQQQCVTTESKKRALPEKPAQKQTVHRKSIDTFGQRTSQYRGVTRHRWTGRYEAHLWDNSCKKEGQTRKGRQVYLGGYDMEDKAARAYDLAALKYWGPSTHINFPLENYHKELEEMKNMSRQEYVAHLRRKSSGFSRGASMYRGVTRHHQHGRWQARIGRVAGNKDLYLGTFTTQEEAAESYDVAAIKFRGANAVTNFDITRYDVEKIMASNTLLAGDLARRKTKELDTTSSMDIPQAAAVGYLTTTSDNNSTSPHNNNGNVTSLLEWNAMLYGSNNNHHEAGLESGGNGFMRVSSSSPFHDLIAMESSLSNGLVDMTAKLGGTHSTSSNPSSLVTSLSSSREGSPEKVVNTSTTAAAATMLFGNKPPLASSKYVSPVTSSSTIPPWFQANLPMFASWNDA